jgi:predicted Zn-dependent protease
MGLIFAAMAGYDPENAVPFWQRMSSGTSSSSELLSDHPSDATRISNIQKWMPEALKYYKPVATTTTTKTTAKSATTTKKTTTAKKK